MMNTWKDTQRNRGYKYRNYLKHIKSMISKKIYDDKLIKLYTEKEIDEASSLLDQTKDLYYDYAATVLLTNRYLIEDELPKEAYLTISLLFATVEKKEKRLTQAKIFYERLSNNKI